MNKTKKTTTKKPKLPPYLLTLAARATGAISKADRHKLICDAFEELHRGLLMPGDIGAVCTYQACHVAAWAIRNALYPVPGSNATEKQSAAWATAYREAIERTAAIDDGEKLAEIAKYELKLS